MLAWLKSYLSGRTQPVAFSGHSSQSSDLPYGVPQGSVLGPLLFTLYTGSVGDIHHHRLCYHLYVDDIGIYLHFRIADEENKRTAVSVVNTALVIFGTGWAVIFSS